MMGQLDGQHRNVGDALVSFVLEVVLGQPQGLVAEPVDGSGQLEGRVEHLDQPLVGVPAIVGGRARESAFFQLDVAYVERREPLDHAGLFIVGARRAPSISAPPAGVSTYYQLIRSLDRQQATAARASP